MASLLLAALLFQTKPAFDFDVNPGSGLNLSVSGVPIIKGSTLQYYQKGWVRGYYSTTYGEESVERIDADTIRETISGYNGIATGTVTYHREGNKLKVHYDLHWGDADPAEIELTAGMISAQALQAGTLTADGAATRSLKLKKYAGGGDFENRRYAPDSSDLVFDAPLTRLEAKMSQPTTFFDARGYAQDYANGKALWWLGDLSLDVSKEKPVTFDVEWQIDPKPILDSKAVQITLASNPAKDVISPDEHMPPVVPRGVVNQLSAKKTLEFTGAYDWPAGRVRFWAADFLGGLARRFELPPVSPNAAHIQVDGGVSKLGLHPGGYQITITENSISVLGEEDEGLHDGLRRLAQLAFVQGGKLVFPTGYLRESPKIVWRGVHLFVGPEARSFQQKLWERVLLPLGFNKVVLQCERTKWDCLPNLRESKDAMTKAELGKLFDDYRAIGVEPIPLIQSFGHMEWFFKGNQNLDLAVNPKIPYTLDPRNPKSKVILDSLWAEACDLLKPTTLHFGCDEVDMRGFPNDHGSLLTDLWAMQMPVLHEIATQHDAKMMLWGDEALAPGEAIDATNGESADMAAKRRAAIPKGSWIGDWHYKADQKAEDFLPSLQLLKKSGLVPVASTWYQPDNIGSFDLAADVEHTGTLQTTWSGYTSDERTMDENFEQYSAMVLASEYSWSSRFDAVDKLGYDPGSIFRKLFYGTPRPTTQRAGDRFFQGSGTADLVDGDMHFQLGDPIALRSLISAPQAPPSVDLSISGKGSHLGLVMDTLDQCDFGEPVADLTIELADGKTLKQRILYGQQVRSSEDGAASSRADTVNGLSVLEIPFGSAATVRGLKIDSLSPSAGFRIHGMIIW